MVANPIEQPVKNQLSGLRVLVAGGSGLIGSQLVQQLLARDESTHIYMPTRRVPKADSAHLHLLIDDLKPEQLGSIEQWLRQQLAGQKLDIFICALGTTLRKAGSQHAFVKVDRDLALGFAAMGRRLGAKRVIWVSSVGARMQSGSFYLRVKGEAERGLAEMGYDRVDIIRPSLLLGDRTESRPAEALAQVLAPIYNPLLFGPFSKYRAIHASQVAAAMTQLSHERKPGWFVHEYRSLRRAA